MKVPGIYNLKTNYTNFRNFQKLPALNIRTGHDSFKSSATEKAIELHQLMNGRIKNPSPVIKEFMQYTGDDYEVAKILAASIKEDKSGLYFTLTDSDKQAVKHLEPECPYFQNYIETLKN